MQLDGKVALVSGGASGLGEATARVLIESGVTVVVMDLNAERGEALAAELGSAFRFVCADVTEEADVKAALEVVHGLGPLGVAVACAGMGAVMRTVGRDGEPHEAGFFERVLRVNLFGTFNVMRLAASAMAGSAPDDLGRRGVIVSTSSVAAYEGQMGQVAYSASKAAIVGMTLPMARDLSKSGIRVCTICPGTMDTPLLAALPEQARAGLAATIPFPRRLGKPREFGLLVRHIVENDYLNGESIRLDGALRMPPK